MNKKIPVPQKSNLIFIFISLFFITLSFLLYQSKNAQFLSLKTSQPPETSMPSFIANVSASEKAKIESKVVAEKLNFERKMIIPKSLGKALQVKSIIQEQGGKLIKDKPNLIVALIPKETEEKTREKLKEADSIEALEIDYPTFLAADSPDWGVTRIEAPKVWPTTEASGIKIAVIDTGLDYTHQDLRGRYAGGYDFTNNDSDPFDDHGHGTHVSGIIASELNEIGIAGVAPKASILAIKVLDWNGTGYISDIVEGIDWAMQNGASVMNFSLGSYYDSTILRNKINEAAGKGIYLVAAAGNDYGGPLLYPAAYSSVISVSATDRSDRFASFSNVGAEIAAPGVSITSAVPGNGYAAWSGTSMAAPHVTATIALMIANKQTDIRNALHNTAIDLGPTGKDSYFGYGLVHAKPAALGEDKLAPVVTFVSPENNSQVNGTVKVQLSVQDENIVTGVKLLIDSQLVKSWTQEPYTYLWETTNITKKTYELLTQASDDSNNTGSAKISVTVSSISPTPSPSPTPRVSPTISQTPGVSPSLSPITSPTSYPERGESGEYRQDISGPAEEHRQNYPNWYEKEEKQISKENASEVTNLNNRNPKPETSAQEKQEKKEEKEKQEKEKKGKVKGIYIRQLADSFWQTLIKSVSTFLNQFSRKNDL